MQFRSAPEGQFGGPRAAKKRPRGVQERARGVHQASKRPGGAVQRAVQSPTWRKTFCVQDVQVHLASTSGQFLMTLHHILQCVRAVLNDSSKWRPQGPFKCPSAAQVVHAMAARWKSQRATAQAKRRPSRPKRRPGGVQEASTRRPSWPKRRPSWPKRRPRGVPKSSHVRSKRRPRGPRDVQEAYKLAPRACQLAPRASNLSSSWLQERPSWPQVRPSWP